MCKWDKIFLRWLHKRGYKTRYYGEGHIHICSSTVVRGSSVTLIIPNQEFYNWEIDTDYSNNIIIAIGKGCERRLNMADPEFFIRLGELFPVIPHNFFVSVDEYLLGFVVRLRGWISWFGRAYIRW